MTGKELWVNINCSSKEIQPLRREKSAQKYDAAQVFDVAQVFGPRPGKFVVALTRVLTTLCNNLAPRT